MELTVHLPGGVRADATFGSFTVSTDQPVKAGGEGTAPSPIAVFLASIGTCAGYYVASFCRQRELSTEGIRIEQVTEADPETGLVAHIRLAIHVPASFPEKYRAALIRSAEQCTVKKHLEHPPRIEVSTLVDG